MQRAHSSSTRRRRPAWSLRARRCAGAADQQHGLLGNVRRNCVRCASRRPASRRTRCSGPATRAGSSRAAVTEFRDGRLGAEVRHPPGRRRQTPAPPSAARSRGLRRAGWRRPRRDRSLADRRSAASERSRSPRRSDRKCSWRISNRPAPTLTDGVDERCEAILRRTPRASSGPSRSSASAVRRSPSNRLTNSQQRVDGVTAGRVGRHDGGASWATASRRSSAASVAGTTSPARWPAPWRRRCAARAPPWRAGTRGVPTVAVRRGKPVTRFPRAQRLDGHAGGARQRADGQHTGRSTGLKRFCPWRD